MLCDVFSLCYVQSLVCFMCSIQCLWLAAKAACRRAPDSLGAFSKYKGGHAGPFLWALVGFFPRALVGPFPWALGEFFPWALVGPFPWALVGPFHLSLVGPLP